METKENEAKIRRITARKTVTKRMDERKKATTK